MSLAIEEVLPFNRINFNDFSVLSDICVSNRWNFMKFIPNIYDHSVVMHMKFHQGFREVISL